MAENKKSFILYADMLKSIDHLTNEEKGILFNHLLEYVNDKNPILEDRLILTAWKPIENQLKRDLKDWEETKIDKSNNGKLGNLKRWNNDLYIQVIDKKLSLNDAINIAENRKVSLPDSHLSPPIANVAVNVNVNDNVNDINKIEYSPSFLKYLLFAEKFAPKLLKMKKPLQDLELQKLTTDYDKEKVKEVFLAMENKKTLLKDYESVYLTANNWLKRADDKDNPKQKKETTPISFGPKKQINGQS